MSISAEQPTESDDRTNITKVVHAATLVVPSMMWIIAFATLLIDVFWLGFAGFTVASKTAIVVTLGTLLMSAVAIFYSTYRPIPAFHSVLFGIVFIIVFTNALALFGYLLTSVALPMRDTVYSGMDQALGFDWIAWLQWMNAHPVVGNGLTWAYQSSIVQLFAVIIFTAFTLRHDRLQAFLSLFVITSMITIIVAGLFPSIGPYAFYGPSPADFSNLNPEAGTWHLEHMLGLRDGTMRHIDIRDIEGLVSFPSFHTALAIITAYALRGIRWIAWPSYILNAFVILSTLSEGGHYLVDIIGGTCITVVAIVMYARRDEIFRAMHNRVGRIGGVWAQQHAWKPNQ